MALDTVTKYTARWLNENFSKLDDNYWDKYVMSVLYPSQRDTVIANGQKTIFDLDQPTLLSVFLQNKTVLIGKLNIDPQLFGYAHNIKDIRNKYFHKNSNQLPLKRIKHDIETMELFLEGLGASHEVVEEVRDGIGVGEKTATKDTSAITPIAKKKVMDTKAELRDTISEVGSEQAEKTQITVSNLTTGGKERSVPLPFETKGYPQTIQDRLNARHIVGFRVETRFGMDAENLYCDCRATEFGYQLADVHFAVLIKRECDSNDSLLEVKKKLDRGFVGLIPEFVEAIVNPTQDSLVWFFGRKKSDESTAANRSIRFVAPPTSGPTAIPRWFQQAIRTEALSHLSAEEVQFTLELPKQDVERYSQTYSPRSFTEGLAVGKGMLNDFAQKVSKARTFKMIDVGCGTAAFSLGVIHGLDRIIDKSFSCSVSLDLIDGNPEMLAKARSFIAARDKSQTYGISSIESVCIEKRISNIIDCFPDHSYDLIVTSKFLGELVGSGIIDAFAAFIEVAKRHLCPGGQIIFVELPKHRDRIETAISSLPKGLAITAMRELEVHPTFTGGDSKDSENVLIVQLSI